MTGRARAADVVLLLLSQEADLARRSTPATLRQRVRRGTSPEATAGTNLREVLAY